MPTIAIIDYGAGNLSSVCKALRKLGEDPIITSDPSTVKSAGIIVLPGVGSAGDAMAGLGKLGLIDAIKESIHRGIPFLGICLGLQVLLDFSEESSGQPCLAVVPGRVRKLGTSLKVPHIGWNQVRQKVQHPLFRGIPDLSNFYFVHSYYPEPEEQADVAGTTEYGLEFCSMIARENLVATQFHPEKSGRWGLEMMKNFLEMAKGTR